MKKNFRKILITISCFAVYFMLFKMVGAADTTYTLLEDSLPGIGKNGVVTGFSTYLSGLFKLSIGIAAVLAILMLSVGGFEYITTEAFTGKQVAKERIKNALMGLILVISAYLILYTVNPDLVDTEFDIPSVGSSQKYESDESNNVYKYKQPQYAGTDRLPCLLQQPPGYTTGKYYSNSTKCGGNDGCCVYKKLTDK